MRIIGNSTSNVAALALSLVAMAQGCGGNDSTGADTTGQANTGGNASTAVSSPTVSTGGVNGVTASGGATSTSTDDNQGGVGTIDVGGHTGGMPSVGSSIGGHAATGGITGTGGSVSSGPVSSIDILYMIDNSSSMADKQQVLAASLPQLLAQLAQPNCVDTSGQILGGSQITQTGPTCALGKLEFKAINDIHIGIVSSSLGDHGAGTGCTPGRSTQYTNPVDGGTISQPPDMNDVGRLMATTMRGTQALQKDTSIIQNANVKLDSKGFLAWGAPSLSTFPTSTDLASATAAFKDMVVATAQMGCGFESQLESWFRFLVDPVPPQYPIAVHDSTTGQTQRTGVDDVLLAQRAAFLRPNSLLLIVMLTDENDCSIRDTDVGWVSADTTQVIPTGSPTCATNPNDRCCYSCTASAPSGCPACADPAATDDGPYQVNIRCYDQKRRFGYNFMYPTSRYYVGLTHKELCPDQTFGDMDCDCAKASSLGALCSPGARRLPNPIYSQVVGTNSQGNQVTSTTTGPARADGSNIFLAGIIGVPWQDISETSSQAANANLQYIPVTDSRWTSAGGIWSQIYGDDDLNIAASDIHMVESVIPRAGLPGPTSTSATVDPKNGHEYNTAREDLEYACIFALEGAAPARPCGCTGSTDSASCKYLNPNDCCSVTFAADGAGGPGGNFSKPLCQNPTTGAFGTTQYYAKGYPGLREIAVLHDYAAGPTGYSDKGGTGNSIVTSICPKVLTAGQESSPGYGYNPVARAIIERIKTRLQN